MAGGYPLLQVSPVYFIGHVHAISAILLLICWLKGENRAGAGAKILDGISPNGVMS